MKGKTPPLSIAAGVDFGNFRRIPGIIEPNLHEQIILAQMRLFQAIIKVMPNHGYQQNFTRWNIKGNAILFSHDAPMTVGKKIMGSGRYLKETMVTYLLDEDGKVDRLAAKLLKTTSILARTHVVKQWLTLLSHVNTWYKDFDEASIERIVEGTREAVEHMARCPRKVTDEAHLELERNMGSDVAMAQQVDARFGNNERREDRAMMENGNEASLSESSRDLPLHYSYVFPTGSQILADDDVRNPAIFNSLMDLAFEEEKKQSKDMLSVASSDETDYEEDGTENPPQQSNANTASMSIATVPTTTPNLEDMLKTIEFEDIDGNDDPFADCAPDEKCHSFRAGTPVNEFNATDMLLGKAFPHVFLLGTAYGRCPGSLSVSQRNHLLKQFTNIPAKNRALLGYLEDVKKRHAVLRGVSVKVKGNIEAIEKNFRFDSHRKREGGAKEGSLAT